MKASRIAGHTLLGSGNCFSVEAEGKVYRVVNFKLEALEDAVKRGVKWPIEVKDIGGVVVVNDPRIPHDMYDDRFCPICCPEDLWTLPQKLEREREILQEVVEIKEGCVITRPGIMCGKDRKN